MTIDEILLVMRRDYGNYASDSASRDTYFYIYIYTFLNSIVIYCFTFKISIIIIIIDFTFRGVHSLECFSVTSFTTLVQPHQIYFIYVANRFK